MLHDILKFQSTCSLARYNIFFRDNYTCRACMYMYAVFIFITLYFFLLGMHTLNIRRVYASLTIKLACAINVVKND